MCYYSYHVRWAAFPSLHLRQFLCNSATPWSACASVLPTGGGGLRTRLQSRKRTGAERSMEKAKG